MSIRFRILDYIDNQYTYRITTYVYYSILTFFGYLSFKDGTNPILPNPVLLIISYILLFTSYQSFQVIEPTSYPDKVLRKRLFFATIPFLLATYESYKYGKKIKSEKGDFAIWLNFFLLSLIFGILTISFILLVMLIQIASTQTHALYILTIGIWMFVPLFLVEKNSFYNPDLDLVNKNFKSQSIRYRLQNTITQIYFSRSRRITIYFFNLIFFGLIVFLNSHFHLYPISVS